MFQYSQPNYTKLHKDVEIQIGIRKRPVTKIFQGDWGLINSQCNKVLELWGQNLNLDRHSLTEIPILMVIILPKS